MAQFYIRRKPDWKKRLLALLISITVFLIAVYIAGNEVNKAEKIISPFHTTIIQTYNERDFRGKTDSLKALYGHNKILPKGYELQTLLALSHYPE